MSQHDDDESSTRFAAFVLKMDDNLGDLAFPCADAVSAFGMCLASGATAFEIFTDVTDDFIRRVNGAERVEHTSGRVIRVTIESNE